MPTHWIEIRTETEEKGIYIKNKRLTNFTWTLRYDPVKDDLYIILHFNRGLSSEVYIKRNEGHRLLQEIVRQEPAAIIAFEHRAEIEILERYLRWSIMRIKRPGNRKGEAEGELYLGIGDNVKKEDCYGEKGESLREVSYTDESGVVEESE